MLRLALLFQLLPELFLALRLVGAAFLIFIAVMMWLHAPEPMPNAGARVFSLPGPARPMPGPRTWWTARLREC